MHYSYTLGNCLMYSSFIGIHMATRDALHRTQFQSRFLTVNDISTHVLSVLPWCLMCLPFQFKIRHALNFICIMVHVPLTFFIVLLHVISASGVQYFHICFHFGFKIVTIIWKWIIFQSALSFTRQPWFLVELFS